MTVAIQDLQGELEIIDGNFQVVQRGFGSLQGEFVPGIYKARARAGDVLREELFAVEPGAELMDVALAALSFASPLPLQGTSTSHEYHQQALESASLGAPADLGLGTGGGLLLSLRDPSNACMRQRDGKPAERDNYRRSFAGLRLCDRAGDLLLDLDQALKQEPDLGYALLNLELSPGNYMLCYEPSGAESVAMPLPVAPGWQTSMFLRVELPQGLAAPGSVDLIDRAVMMVPLGTAFFPGDHHFRLAEIARYALVQGRPVLERKQVEAMLHEKFHNPMLGLLVAHVLLLRKDPPPALLQLVIDNLTGMIGQASPDVIALRLALAELRGRNPSLPRSGVAFPPLLRVSWEILARYPKLLTSGSMMGAVASRLAPQGPWVAWKPQEQSEPTNARFVVGFLPNMPAFATSRLQRMVTGINSRKLAGGAFRTPQTAKTGAEAVDALDILLQLARDVPWHGLTRSLRAAVTDGNLLDQLTSLQRTLIPTLQLIAEQIEDGDEFTLDELEQLCQGLNIAMPVLRESLNDLAKTVARAGVELLAGEDR
ncbi:hypothetical protein [Stutzerimonas stutzeri]|uniref:hypothetical protein n=1 Tax=Stutzerimonas stutzeri TaxID=316 RepID=UPI001268631F|nr:hypothetical protein [Stutzerimonas stutzeri]